MTKYNLSDAEYEIMKYIWECDEPASFREILAYTGEIGHTWKKQTVQTFLTRLIGKGALQAERRGNRHYYSPTMTETEYLSEWTKELLNENFEGSLKKFMVAFTGGKTLTESEAKELHDFLEDEGTGES